jgi:hypothetical protein
MPGSTRKVQPATSLRGEAVGGHPSADRTLGPVSDFEFSCFSTCPAGRSTLRPATNLKDSKNKAEPATPSASLP